ncbi:MAG: MFS transporter [Saprospiraceae bacterium]
MQKNDQPLYTSSFLLLCTSFALFGASFNMIIPELPAYITSLGGAEYKGLIIALFTLTAGISRPFSGKLADTIGRVPIIVFGAIVCIICSLIYPVLSTVSGFLLLRLLHGFSTGFTPTAITAYVADIVSEKRRGEAMGIMGISINLGSSIGPFVGSYIAAYQSLNLMFYVSSGIALLSMILLLNLKETLNEKQAFHPRLLLLKRNEIFDKSSVIPAIACGLIYLGFGAIITITPDQSVHLGMVNKGAFFTSFTLCSILSRIVAGRLSDIYGRVVAIRLSAIMLAIGFVFFGMSQSPTWLLVSSGVVGFSLGVGIPALFAWTIDRSEVQHRGKAMATLYIGLEVAIGSGALLGAAIYDNNFANFSTTFNIIAIFPLIALLFLWKEKDVVMVG